VSSPPWWGGQWSPTRCQRRANTDPSAAAHGRTSIRATVLTNVHREWVDSLGDLSGEDGKPFPAAAVVAYAYRHSFAQRHADAGTPMDVLRDLMGHRSTYSTQGY
jgi:integrase